MNWHPRFLKTLLSGLLAGAFLVTAIAGCEKNPLLVDSKPDPTPVPVATPTPDPADVSDPRWYPANKADFQWVSLPADGKKALIQAIRNCTFGVMIETSALSDPEIIQALAKASRNTTRTGNKVSVGVIFNAYGENRTRNQQTFNQLKDMGFYIVWAQDPKEMGGPDGKRTFTPEFRDLKGSNILIMDEMIFSGNQPTVVGAVYAFDHDLTPEGFSQPGDMLISTVSKDIFEAMNGINAVYYLQPFQQTNPNVVIGPLLTRRRLPEILGAAKTTLDLRVGSLSDPELISLLSDRVRAGVAVRIVLPKAQAAQKDALVKAGVSEVRLVEHASGCLAVIDHKAVLHGGLPLDAEAIDLDRSQSLSVENAEIARKASARFEASWSQAE